MRFIYMLISIVFLLFAAFQWNDSDALLWMVTYGVISFGFFCAAFGSFFHTQTLILTLLFMVWVLTYTPIFLTWVQNGMPSIVDSMQATQPYIEYMREFWGLTISLIALLFLYSQGKKVAHQTVEAS